jgi:PKD repeat protein
MNRRNLAVFSFILLLAAGGCNKNEPVPVAGFAFSASNQFKVPCTVQFANQSVQGNSFEWWFGTDSSRVSIDPASSVLKDPIFVYNKPGKFTVTLRAYTESRKEWASASQVVTIKDTIK